MFKFLKYLQPTSYFSLVRNNNSYIFPKIKSIPRSVLLNLEEDGFYKSEIAKVYDLSWQAIHKGYIDDTKTIEQITPIPLEDNYHFIRKHFSPFWVFYVFVLRIISLKNPIKEFRGWFKTRNTKRVDLYVNTIDYDNWDTYNSSLIKDSPKVSVVIPTLNRYTYLKDVLNDLEAQRYTNFEVIVIDQTVPFQKQFYKDFNLDLKLIYQEEKALWLARNTAIKAAKGDYLLFFDDDSRVEKDWIEQHLKCIDFFNADISSGVSISKVGAKVPDHYTFFRISDQLDTGNVMIKKKVFYTIGLFDRQFEKQRMGDGEFGLRAYLEGYLNISNPYAKRLHLKVGSGGLRDMGSWDAFRTQNWLAPRPIPSVLYFFRRYFGNTAARYALLRTIPLSVMPYKFKSSKPMLILGVFVMLLLIPLILFQVAKSWQLSTKKLKQGPLIETL